MKSKKTQNKKTNKVFVIVEAVIALCAIGFIIGLIATNSKVTPKNFDSIKRTMTYEEVVKLLGEPDDKIELPSGTDYYWFKGAKNIANADKKIEKGKEVYYIRIHFSGGRMSNRNDGYWYDFRHPQEK